MKSTTDNTDDETQTEWKLLMPSQNDGVGWKLTHTSNSDSVHMESYWSTDVDAEISIPFTYLDELVAGLQEAYWNLAAGEWKDREWRFPVGDGDMLIQSHEGELVASIQNYLTTERVQFTPDLFDLMFPGFNKARYDLTEEVDTSEGKFQILYQENERDHLLHNGEQVCPHDSTLGYRPEVKRIEALSDRELSLLASKATNLCGYCQRFLKKNELLDATNHGELPSFACPECGDDAMAVQQLATGGEVEHRDGTKHEFNFSVYENWRRGDAPEQLSE